MAWSAKSLNVFVTVLLRLTNRALALDNSVTSMSQMSSRKNFTVLRDQRTMLFIKTLSINIQLKHS